MSLILDSFSGWVVVRIQQSEVCSAGGVAVRKTLAADRAVLCGVTEGSLRGHPEHRCVLEKKRRQYMTGNYIRSNINHIF